MSSVKKKRAIKEITSNLQVLDAAEFEYLGHLLVRTLEGEALAHHGLTLEGKPTGYSVDSISYNRDTVGEYSTNAKYFKEDFNKIKSDANHAKTEAPNLRSLYLLSNRVCSKPTQKKALREAQSQCPNLNPSNIHLLGAHEIAAEIYEEFILNESTSTNYVADILPAVGRLRQVEVFEYLPRATCPTFARDERRYQTIDEIIGENDVVVISGLSGTGKTQAVADWLHDNREDFHGALWIQGRTVPENHNFRSVNVSRYGTKVNLTHRLSQPKGILVVDDYTGDISSLVASLRSLQGPDSKTVITTQRDQGGQWASVTLDTVSDETAVNILGVEDDDPGLSNIFRLSRKSPLLLEILRGLMETEGISLNALADELEQNLGNFEDPSGELIAERLLGRHQKSIKNELAYLKWVNKQSVEQELIREMIGSTGIIKLRRRHVTSTGPTGRIEIHDIVLNCLTELNLPDVDEPARDRFWSYVAKHSIDPGRHHITVLHQFSRLIEEKMQQPPTLGLEAYAYLQLEKSTQTPDIVGELAHSNPPDHTDNWYSIAAWIEARESWRWMGNLQQSEKKAWNNESAQHLLEIRQHLSNDEIEALVVHHAGKFKKAAKDMHEAEKLFQKALNLDNEFHQAKLQLVRLYRKTNKTEKAYTLLEELLETAWDGVMPITVTLAAFAETGAYPDLIQRFILEPTEDFKDLLRSAIVEGFSQPIETLAAVARALEFRDPKMVLQLSDIFDPPSDSEIDSYKAERWARLYTVVAACRKKLSQERWRRDGELASEYYDRINSKNDYVCTRYARCLLLLEQYERSLKVLSEVSGVFADRIRGKAYLGMKDIERAKKTAEQAYTASQSKPDRYRWGFAELKAEVLDAEEDPKCLVYYDEALNLLPDGNEYTYERLTAKVEKVREKYDNKKQS